MESPKRHPDTGLSTLKPIIVRWGVALGVALCVWTLALHALGFYTRNIAAGKSADIIVTVLPVLMIALALRQRARNVRALTFRDTLAISVGIGGISALFSVPFLWIYHHFINPDWLRYLVTYEEQHLAASNVPAAEIQKAIAALERSGTTANQITAGIIGSLMMGVVIGLLAYAVIRVYRAAHGK